MDKISVIIPVKDVTKKWSPWLMITARCDTYGKSCVSVGIMWDLRMLVASLRKNWLENLVLEFDNDVGAKGGMIR